MARCGLTYYNKQMTKDTFNDSACDIDPIQGWVTVCEMLDLALPDWKTIAPDAPAVEQVQLALERLGNSVTELQDLHHQIRQEMATIRFVLSMEGIPEKARQELQAHIIRLARMV